MQTLYLVAVLGTRFIGVISILILSHIMATEAFGRFALINTNALLVQMLAGSWLISITNRSLVTDASVVDREMLSTILSVVLVLLTSITCGAVAYTAWRPEVGTYAFATAGLAITFIICDATLAVKNALGREADYATFAVLRNILTLIISVGLVWVGWGALGPVAGILLGAVIAFLLLPETRRVWMKARPGWAAFKRIRPHLSWGMSGGLILGIYILVTAPSRNIIADNFGVSAVGVWTLSADLFFGPLVVIGNAYALSQMRLIYLAASKSDEVALDERARDLMEFTLALALPYLIGGWLFADKALTLLLSEAQSDLASGIAIAAAVQGPALLVLYSLSSVVLARHRFKLVVAQVFTVMVLTALSALAGVDFEGAARLSSIAAVATTLSWLIWCVAAGLVRVRGREIVKLILSSVAFLVVSLACLSLFQLTGGWIIAAVLGALTFSALAIRLRLQGFVAALPPAMRRFVRC
jgi:O-antigen/teichoic acid export membrane protein